MIYKVSGMAYVPARFSLLIEAKTEEEALAKAKGCPNWRDGYEEGTGEGRLAFEWEPSIAEESNGRYEPPAGRDTK